jgi:hypothetical protein
MHSLKFDYGVYFVWVKSIKNSLLSYISAELFLWPCGMFCRAAENGSIANLLSPQYQCRLALKT